MNKNTTHPLDRALPPLFSNPGGNKLLYFQIGTDFLTFLGAILGGYGLYILLVGHPLPEGILFYAKLGGVFATAGVVAFYVTGLYQHQASIMNLLETRKLIRVVFLLFLLLILYSFFTHSPFSRITLSLSLILLLPMLALGRFVFFKINQHNYLHGIAVRNVLIIGAGPTGRLLFQSLSHTPKLGYFPVGFLETDAQDRQYLQDLQYPDRKRQIEVMKDFPQCIDFIQQHKIHDIIISKPLYSNHDQEFQVLLANCRQQGIQLHTIPYLLSLFGESVQLHDINGIPMISFQDIRVGRLEQLIKRSFDLTVALLLTPFFFPLMLLIALVIKLDSRGPVLFKQQRVGKDGVVFVMYKFRTMFTDAPAYGSSPSRPGDNRVTRVGKLLRKVSLDELPQLLNVLEGSMSLVGPRPEMEFIVENEYNELYRQRLRVKPGVTGVWQISTDRKREIHEDISYDLFYIAHRSLLLDILILLRTVPALLFMQTY